MTARPRPLAARLLEMACGFRCGVVPPVQLVEGTFADVPGVHNACIVGDTDSTRLATSGGFGRRAGDALGAAIGESLERYAASVAPMPLATRRELGAGARVVDVREFALFSEAQLAEPGFPHARPDADALRYTRVFDAKDNREAWAPHELVSLGARAEPATIPSTSTGLAAGTDPLGALLRALEEVLERDALAVYWMNGLGGRELELPARYADPVRARGGEVMAFDVTQAWNPHPVVALCGHVPLRGRRRIAMGAACRGALDDAIEKAYLEFLQGVVFAGYFANDNPGLAFPTGRDVHGFEEHGGYYTLHPERWDAVPLVARRRAAPGPPRGRSSRAGASAGDELGALVRALAASGVRVFYRELTTADVAQAGLRVVRAISPELTLLHGDERAPFLGGRARDWRWRFPDAPPPAPGAAFPSTHPHPLG